MRSTALAGWLVVSCMMPWPSRMRDVRWLAAARNTSGAEEWLYSSRKWCSTASPVVAQLISSSSSGVVVQPPLAVRLPGAASCNS